MKCPLVSVLVGATLCMLTMIPAQASETMTGHVTMLEPTYMPGALVLTLDTGNEICPAGTLLTWDKGDLETIKTVYATALAAIVSGQKVNFVTEDIETMKNDEDQRCKGQFFHITFSK